MLKRCLGLLVVALAWGGSIHSAHAEHERWYEFEGTHFAFSIERFMGIDFTDPEGPNNSHVTARLLLNADEPVPTSIARAGFDVFIHRFSIGLAGGVATHDVAVINPRVGYLFGLTPQLGIWFRAGGFFAKAGPQEWFGVDAEALFAWFPYPILALHVGPTIDLAFGNSRTPNYVDLGLPQFGMTAFF
jgi:hypothetical protein